MAYWYNITDSSVQSWIKRMAAYEAGGYSSWDGFRLNLLKYHQHDQDSPRLNKILGFTVRVIRWRMKFDFPFLGPIKDEWIAEEDILNYIKDIREWKLAMEQSRISVQRGGVFIPHEQPFCHEQSMPDGTRSPFEKTETSG